MIFEQQRQGDFNIIILLLQTFFFICDGIYQPYPSLQASFQIISIAIIRVLINLQHTRPIAEKWIGTRNYI